MKFRHVSYVVCCVLFSTIVNYSQSLNEIEQKLKSRLSGKVLTLKHFYVENKQHFLKDGTLKNGSATGPWTIYGKMDIQKVTLKEHRMELEGSRVYVAYAPRDGKPVLYRAPATTPAIYMTIDLPDAVDETAVEAAMKEVFMDDTDLMTDYVPELWASYFRHGQQSRTSGYSDQAGPKEPARDADDARTEASKSSPPAISEATLGKIIKSVTPEYPELALQYGIRGSVMLAATITKEGTLSKIYVVKPAGMGMDEEAAKALKQWQYSLYLLNGKPAEVEIAITVSFKSR